MKVFQPAPVSVSSCRGRLISITLATVCLGLAATARAQLPTFGPPAVLNAGANKDQAKDEAARIVSDGLGVWVVVWQSTGSAAAGPDSFGRDADILFVRSADNGVTWTAPAAVSSRARKDQGLDLTPALATDGKGTWIVVWSSTEDLTGSRRNDRDIQIAISTDDARTWSLPRYLNGNATRDWGDDESPDIATDAAGHWVVVWQSTDSLGNTIGGDRDVLAAASSDGGLTWSDPKPLDEAAAHDQRSDDAPRLATDRRGHWMTVWASSGATADRSRYDHFILSATSADNGATWRAPSPVTGGDDKQSREWNPRLATDGQGHWLCGWSSTDTLNGRLGRDRDVLAARSDDDGTTWSAPSPVNREAERDAGDDGSPEIATDGRGAWIAVWTTWDSRQRTIGSDGDLAMAASHDNGQTWTASAVVNPNAATDYGGDFNPAIATDRRGLWLVVWDTNEPEGGAIGTDRDLMVVSGRLSQEISGPVAPPVAR